MKLISEFIRRAAFGCLAGSALINPLTAQTLYDSGGFEGPSFVAGQPLEGQDPAPPVGNGPWRKDAGTSIAEVVATNPVEATKSVRLTRTAGATGDTRWAVVKPATPSGLNNIINLEFDMRVRRTANDFGPLFGVEAYDGAIGTPKLLGSLLVDSGNGEIVHHQATTGAQTGTGVYLDLVLHHHFRLSMNFTDRKCSIWVDGKLVHVENFVNSAATGFTDGSLVTLATGSGNDAGVAYVDNYRIQQTTSQLPYLLWQGDGIANTWKVGGALTWYDGFTPVTYVDGKPARFDDDGSIAPPIDVQGSVSPESVTLSASKSYTFSGTGSIAGATGILKEGTGKLTITNANTYTGETALRGGELSVRNTAGSATGNGKVTVFPMSTISGDGTVGGSLWVASGGVVKPGADGVGTLHVGENLVLDNANLTFELGSNSDQVAVVGDVTLGGTLDVVGVAGFGPGSYSLITYGGALNAGSFLVDSAPAGYDYRIDTASAGVVKLVVTPPPPMPDAPGNLAATTSGTSAINLNWSDLSSNEDAFLVQRSGDGAAFTTVATVGANVTNFADNGLAPGTTYFYRVRARNAGGESGNSNIASATTESSAVTAHYEFELNALDSSGNNNHGISTGAVLYEEGQVGEYAATFGGTGFVEITRVVESDFTVMMWVKTTANASGGAWYSGMGLIDGETVGSGADWGCSILNSKFAFGVGAPDTTISSKRSVNDGSWHHVAATRNNTTGEVKLYIDGVLDTTGVAPTGSRTAPTQLRIGATQTANPVFYNGAMDDLRFYGSRLNAQEIATAADLPVPPPPPTSDPLVIWPLGDSITWGYTTASAADSPGGYREPLYRNLLVNGYPSMKFVGANTSNPGPILTRDGQVNHDGYPQYTLTEINANLNSNAPTGKTRGNNGGFWLTGTGGRAALDPDMVLLLAGTNDIEGGAAAPLIEQRLDAMVTKIFTLRPQTKIFLASIPPYPADAAKTATAKAYNGLLLSKTIPKFLNLGFNIRFVDQYANFIASSSPAGDVVISSLYGDTIHPNEAGYQRMGDTWAAALLADPVDPPATPGSLVASAPTSDAVQLSWSDLSSNEGAFLIQRASDGGDFATVGFVGANQTSFTDSSVAPVSAYQYRVSARNTSGDSDFSNVASVSTPAPPAPAAPAGLVAFGGRGVVSLSWSGVTNATSYQIKRATTDGGSYTTVGTVGSTTFLDTTVTNGSLYFYVVTATGTGGESAVSNQATAAPDAFRALVWEGAVNHRWDDFASANWRDSGNRLARFSQEDRVRFDDSGAATDAIEIAGTQEITALTVDSTKDYRIGGSGKLIGSGGLVKSGAGTLTLSSHAAFGGDTTVTAGTLRLSALAHRWSFNGNLGDAAGGRDATIVDQGGQNAVLSPTAVVLTGGARNDSDYVDLGSNLLPDVNQPVTIELWATQVGTRNFSRIFDFGKDSTENLFMGWTIGTALASDRVEWRDATAATQDNTNQPYALGTEFHIAMVIEPGVGAGGTTRVTWYSAPAAAPNLGPAKGSFDTSNTLADFNDVNGWLGRSAWTTDETAAAAYNEMRIWRRPFSASGLQVLHQAGSDANLATVVLDAGSTKTPAIPILPPTTNVDLSGGVLEIATGMNQPVGALSGAAGSEIRLSSGSLTAGANTSTVFAGSLTGSGSFTKTGSGVLTLTGSDSHTGGTTVAAGTLQLDGNGTAATGSVTIQTGATLGGRGTISGAVALESGGTLAPGASVGTLATGANVWQGGASYAWEIADAQAGGDLISITGSLAIAGNASAPITIRAISLNAAGAPGAVPNIPIGAPSTWKLATTTVGITGFSADAFTVDSTSFQTPGTFEVSVGNGSKDLLLTFTPSGGFDAWVRLKFSAADAADSGISGPLKDPDGDGITNLEEYAFGGDPRAADRSILPTAMLQDGYLTLTVTRLLDRQDLSYAATAGNDLLSFGTVGESSAGAPFVGRNGGTVTTATVDPLDSNKESVTIRDSVPVTSTPRRFMRASITRP